MKKVFQNKQVADYAYSKLERSPAVSISDKEMSDIFNVKTEFEDGDNTYLQSAWVNGKCIGVTDVFEGEAQHYTGDKYDEVKKAIENEL